jgi:ribosomal protein S18 acetylase RimI-like enzyme
MGHILDNAVWSALSTRQSKLAIGGDLARRFNPEFTTLAAVEKETAEAFEALKQITPPGEVAGVRSFNDLSKMDGWNCKFAFYIVQMVCHELKPCRQVDFEVLTMADNDAVQELVRLTEPGPFSSRTLELGAYIGIRDGGKLVAMAGERMKLPGYEEISAVCTHPDYQRRGYARALVSTLAEMIRARGNIPFLSAKEGNAPAIRSYESIGFEVRTKIGNFGLSPSIASGFD